MAILLFLVASFLILLAAYAVMGRVLARMFALDPDRATPAHLRRDGLDYEPARMTYLLPQHFSAIAAAGPIVGPILAGLYFGWGPAWIWIIVGSVLIGGVHDFTALVASIRHGGRSVAEIVRLYMNPRAYILFLVFIWSALVYVIIAFTDITAGTFVSRASLSDGTAGGPAVATSSSLYLGLALLMGLVLRFTRLGPVRAKMVFLPLVALAIWAGPRLPLDLGAVWPLLGDLSDAQRAWGFILLGYCFAAAMAPVWLLLQPRGELGGYFLYIVMGVGMAGVLAGAVEGDMHIQHEFFKGWSAPDAAGAFGGTTPLFPILFITVACGACSGFHSIVASGTTSKQLNRETDARPVAYGGMLLEGFFACLSLATLMVLAPGAAKSSPDAIYAGGIAEFGTRVGGLLGGDADAVYDALMPFALLCFATFVFDTLDACTRLARYVMMELTGWTTRWQAVVATLVSLALPVVALMIPPLVVDGRKMPLWRVFWNIFGSSNQLLAALTLLGVTVWMARRRMNYWLALVPTVFMMVMTLWSLVLMAAPYVAMWREGRPIETFRHFQFGITVTLLALSGWLIVEALLTWGAIRAGRAGGPGAAEDAPAAAGAQETL